MMIRVFYPYWDWEDYQSGMYDELSDFREYRVQAAVKLLSDESLCRHFMQEVITRWKKSTLHNLTNTGCNRKAWLGQCACNLYAGVKEDETREAWKLLTEDQQIKANSIAKDIIDEWVSLYEKNVRN